MLLQHQNLNADIISRSLEASTNAETKDFFVAKCEDYAEDWEAWQTRKEYYDLNRQTIIIKVRAIRS